MNKITDSQRALILLAIETGGRIVNFPKNLGGGARTAVMRGLLLHGLIVADGTGHALTKAGYEAVDLQPPQASIEANEDFEADTEAEIDTGADANDAHEPVGTPGDGPAQSNTELSGGEAPPTRDIGSAVTAPPKTQRGKRIDQVVALLLRPQGVTIKEVMEVTNWQPHSVRGFFAGTLKKKGYELISDKLGKTDRVYRIQAEEATVPDLKSDEEE